LAICLGLNASKYHQSVLTKLEQENLHTHESQLTDKERFKDVTKWNPTCNYCKQDFEFSGLVEVSVCVNIEIHYLICSLMELYKVPLCAETQFVSKPCQLPH
jgi:hypothetical protein